MTYLIKIQFYSPDSIPTATGEFSIQAIDKRDALNQIISQISNSGYNKNEFSIIFIMEI
jgi:hypothetical protein